MLLIKILCKKKVSKYAKKFVYMKRCSFFTIVSRSLVNFFLKLEFVEFLGSSDTFFQKLVVNMRQ